MNDLAIAGDHSAAEALQEGRLADPFSYLGLHETTRGTVARAFLPGALGVDVFVRDGGEWLGRLQPVEHTGLFVGPLSRRTDYVLRIEWPQSVQETEDPYSFGPILGDVDLHLFAEGVHWNLPERFGAAVDSLGGGRRSLLCRLAVRSLAPNAPRSAPSTRSGTLAKVISPSSDAKTAPPMRAAPQRPVRIVPLNHCTETRRRSITAASVPSTESGGS